MWNCSVIQLLCVLFELIPICTVWSLHVQAEKARAVILKKCCRRQLRPHSMGDWTQHNAQLPFHTVSPPFTHQTSAHVRVSVRAMFSEVPLESATYQIHFVLKPITRTLYVNWRIDAPMAAAVNCDVCTIYVTSFNTLHYPEDGGNKLLRNVGTCIPT